MFTGLFLAWLNIIAAIPLIGTLGYHRVVGHEEVLLLRRFGAHYLKYQKTTGKFFPRIVRIRSP